MSDPNDIIINAIRRKFGSSIIDTLREQEPLSLRVNTGDTLTIPLIGEAKVFWEKFSPVPQLSVEVRTHCQEKSLAARKIFSTASVKSVDESYAIADYLVKQIRNELAQVIIDTYEQTKC